MNLNMATFPKLFRRCAISVLLKRWASTSFLSLIVILFLGIAGCATNDDALLQKSREYQLQLETLKARAARDQAEKEQQQERAKRIDAERRRLQAELRAKRAENDLQLEAERRKREVAIREERRRQTVAKKEVVSSLNELASASDQIRGLRENLAGLSLRLTTFEDAARLDEALGRARGLDAKFDKLGEEINKIRSDVNSSRNGLSRGLRRRVSSLRTTVNQAFDEISQLESEIGQLEAEQRARAAGPTPKDVWPGMTQTRWQGVDRRIRDFISRRYGHLLKFNEGY